MYRHTSNDHNLHVCQKTRTKELTDRTARTLNDSQENYNDEEEEGNVKDHTVELIFISSRVLNFISYAAASTHTNIHVEKVALREEVRKQAIRISDPK